MKFQKRAICIVKLVGKVLLDTNEKNTAAKAMYDKHGYTETGIVPIEFNGISGVKLVLLEKHSGKQLVFLRSDKAKKCGSTSAPIPERLSKTAA